MFILALIVLMPCLWLAYGILDALDHIGKIAEEHEKDLYPSCLHHKN